MAITAILKMATASFDAGTCSLRYSVDFVDDTLGNIGAKGYDVTDPQTIAAVMAYVEQMLPSIEQQVGVPVILPPAPPTPPDPDPVP